MSNVQNNRPPHLSGLDAVLNNLIENGWVFGNPIYSPDKKSYLYKGIPPVGEFKLQIILTGVNENNFFIIAIGTKWNTIGAMSDKDEDKAIETLTNVIDKARTGAQEDLHPEINQFMASINEE